MYFVASIEWGFCREECMLMSAGKITHWNQVAMVLPLPIVAVRNMPGLSRYRIVNGKIQISGLLRLQPNHLARHQGNVEYP